MPTTTKLNHQLTKIDSMRQVLILPLEDDKPSYTHNHPNGICTYIWLICIVNVGKYAIHESHGIY